MNQDVKHVDPLTFNSISRNLAQRTILTNVQIYVEKYNYCDSDFIYETHFMWFYFEYIENVLY